MKLKDPLSGAFHFGGALLSVAAIVLLVLSGLGDPWKIVSFSIYGATLVALYSFSTLYHWLPQEAVGNSQLFRKLDHTSIYLLIAGTYTPFCLVTLRGPWGWSLLGIVWGLAVAGILIRHLNINTGRWVRTLIYVGMGWIAVVAVRPIFESLPLNGIYLLVAGGLAYSTGGIVYAAKKPNFSKAFGFHELWHLFVLMGSLLHFLCILIFV
jgi:hemolysin III